MRLDGISVEGFLKEPVSKQSILDCLLAASQPEDNGAYLQTVAMYLLLCLLGAHNGGERHRDAECAGSVQAARTSA